MRHKLCRPLLIRLRLLPVRELIALCCLLPLAAAGQASAPAAPPLSIAQLVGNMVQLNLDRAQALHSYQGTRTYTLNYQGFLNKIRAQMVVDVTYIAPDTKQFQIVSQSGPRWMVDQVLKRLIRTESDAQKNAARRGVDLNRENYDFTGLQYQPEADGCSYSLHVQPKTPSKYLYRGRIWINDRDFAVCRIQAEPAKNPSFWIKKTTISHRYEKVGDFWLPASNTSVSSIRVGGTATLTIQYENYRILHASALQKLPASGAVSSQNSVQ